MRNFGKQNRKDRPFSFLRRPPGGVLPHVQFVIAIVLLTGFVIGPVLLFSYGCTERLPAEPVEEVPAAPAPDSVTVAICPFGEGTFATDEISHVDVLVYDADGLGKLVSLSRMTYSGSPLEVKCAGGVVDIVVIANLAGRLNAAALDRFDTAELLTADFHDDDPSHRVASGSCRVEAEGGCEVEIGLLPLMSCVTLASVTNTMPGYVRLEDPRVWITGLNPAAEIMRQDGFRPGETIADGDPLPLPYDVGFYTQYPGLHLWCYPNDTPELTLGVTRTGITLECVIKGELCRFSADLPPVPRDGSIRAELTVDSPTEGYWQFE